MQLTTRGSVRAEPNVTPMIDVMLVLLVIFMIVVPALLSGTHAVAPQGDNLTAHPENAEDRVLAIDRDGRYYLNKRAIEADSLDAALQMALASRADDHVLYVTADKNLTYGVVQNALTVAGTAGFRVVGLVTEKRPKPNAALR